MYVNRTNSHEFPKRYGSSSYCVRKSLLHATLQVTLMTTPPGVARALVFCEIRILLEKVRVFWFEVRFMHTHHIWIVFVEEYWNVFEVSQVSHVSLHDLCIHTECELELCALGGSVALVCPFQVPQRLSNPFQVCCGRECPAAPYALCVERRLATCPCNLVRIWTHALESQVTKFRLHATSLT